MNNKLIGLTLLAALPLAASAQLGFNTSGFTSAYTPETGTGVDAYQSYELLSPGTLCQPLNGAWINVPLTMPDNSQPSAMLINGGYPDANMWTEMQTVSGPNQTFSYYGTAVYGGDTASSGTAATLQLYVDGNAVGSAQQIVYNNATPGQMALYSVSLAGVSAGSHTFELIDTDGAFGGNDFALAAATPEPAPFAALGLGALCFIRRRRNR